MQIKVAARPACSWRLRAAAAAALATLSLRAVAATPAHWISTSSGSWSDAANWSTNPFFPNNGNPAGSTYDVTLPSLPSQYTVSLAGNFIINSLSDNALLSIGSTSACSLLLNGDQTISGTGQISFDGTSSISQDVIGSKGGTLTISPSITIRSGAQGGFVGDYPANLINQGTIAAQTPGQTLTINGASWTNTGTLRADAGTLALGGSFTTAGIGTIVRTNGAIAVTGDWNNSNATLNLDALGPLFLSDGTIRGGTITGSPANPIQVLIGQFNNGGHLDNVTLSGTANVTPGAGLGIQNGLVLNNGHLNFTGASRLSAIGGAQSLSGTGELLFDNGGPVLNVAGVAIGSGITIRTITSDPLNPSGGLTIAGGGFNNSGLISSEVPSRTIFIVDVSTGFTNTGTIQSLNGGGLSIQRVDNVGQITANGGSFSIGNILSNTGAITAVNSTVTLGVQGGTMTTAQLGNFTRTGGSLTLKGTLDASGTTYDLHGGTGPIILDGIINGGTILGSGGEKITIAGPISSGNLYGVTLAVGLDVLNGATAYMQNGLHLSNSTITLDSPDVSCSLVFQGAQSLDGTGTIVFNTTSGSVGYSSLTIGTGITIKTNTAGGTISGGGSPSEMLVNNGTLMSQTPGKTLVVGSGTSTNYGTISASPGGILTLAGRWTNYGTITADSTTINLAAAVTGPGTFSVTNSNLNLTGTFTPAEFRGLPFSSNTVSLAGGTIDATGSELHLDAVTGSLRINNNSTLIGGRFSADPGYQNLLVTPATCFFNGITLASPFTVPSGGLVIVGNGLTLDNTTISLGSGPSSSRMSFSGTQTLRGTGTIVLNGTAAQNLIFPSSGTLTIGPGITIKTGTQGGVVGESINKKLAAISQGVISAETPGTTITISGSAFTNQGTLQATNGGTIALGTTPLTNLANNTLTGGTYTVGVNSTLSFGTRTFATNAADVTLSGTNSTFAAIAPLAVNSGSFTVTAGRDFSTAGALSNTGRLAAGAASDLTITGDLTAGAASVLAVELSSAATNESYGQFAATGQVSLAGAFEADLAAAYDLHPGDTFTVLSAASINGTFSSIVLPPGFAGDLAYSPSTVQLTLTAVPEPAAMTLLTVVPLFCLGRRRRGSP